MLDAKSCGAETVPELVAPQTALPVDAPPLVAVVQRAHGGRPGDPRVLPVIPMLSELRRWMSA